MTHHNIPAGIPNVGNTCYVSSVIQCLRRLDLLLANQLQLPDITFQLEDVVEYLDSLLSLNPLIRSKISLTLESEGTQYLSNVIHVDSSGKNIEKIISLNRCIIVLRIPSNISILEIYPLNLITKTLSISYVAKAFICYNGGHYYSIVNWNDEWYMYNDSQVLLLGKDGISVYTKLPIVVVFYILQ